MNTNTLTSTELIVNTKSPCGIQTDPAILIIRTYDKKGEWGIEAIFEGGAKVTGTATTDFVNALESDLSDQGWQIEPSLFHGGFNAKPPQVEELIFASSAGLWTDDYGLPEPTL